MARRQVQRSIQAFTTATKPQDINSLPGKKRKAESTASEADDERPQTVSVSVTSKRRRVVIITPPGTPTKSTKAAQNLNAALSSAKLKRKREEEDIDIDIQTSSPPATPPSSNPDALLLGIEDLRRLNSAFLSALSLHFAHSGTSNSVDIRVLTPSVTKAWGKRKVTLEDIRLLVGVVHSSSAKSQMPSRFCLRDYGQGKVCIEVPAQRKTRSPLSSAFNDTIIAKAFEQNLSRAWETWSAGSSTDVATFIESLPLETLAVSSTVAKIAPIRAKNQRRLEEVLTPFKNFNISDDSPARPNKRTKSTGEATPSKDKENQEPQESVKPVERSLSLLERIKAKEAVAANAPAGPTKEERERMAALQRSEELLEILNVLSMAKGSSRVSFPLTTLVSNVQASLRNPLAKEEIIRCVKVLQTEIAPGHISLMTYGSITGVVVDRNRKPLMVEVKERLRARGV